MGKEPVASNSGDGNIITLIGAGTVYVIAYQSGNEYYNSSAYTFSFDVFSKLGSPDNVNELNRVTEQLFPNPNQGHFTVSSSQEDVFKIISLDGTILQCGSYILANKAIYIFQNGFTNQKLQKNDTKNEFKSIHKFRINTFQAVYNFKLAYAFNRMLI